MGEKKIQKHVYLLQDHVQVLENLMENKVGINNYSEAIRYIINVYSGQLAEEDSKVNQRKINAISKNVDVLIELVAGGLHELSIKAIGKAEDTYVYSDAKKHVEENIQRAITMKSNHKNSNTVTEKSVAVDSVEKPVQVSGKRSYSRIFE